jgi:Mycothiol maleylpyruvate isomerase N-terminal domain
MSAPAGSAYPHPDVRVNAKRGGGGGGNVAARCDDSGMEVTADDLGGLLRAATAAHRRMQVSASRVTDDDCRRPSLLPGWSRGHVLPHWARNADGQSRMLLAAMHGEIAEQYRGVMNGARARSRPGPTGPRG